MSFIHKTLLCITAWCISSTAMLSFHAYFKSMLSVELQISISFVASYQSNFVLELCFTE